MFVCERTGRVYDTPSLALAIEGSCDPPISYPVGMSIPITGYDRAGNIVSAMDTRQGVIGDQSESSQYWMDAGWTGAEPDYLTKLHYSDAQFAYDNAVKISQNRAQTLPKVSATIATLAGTEQRFIPEFVIPDEIENFLGNVSKSASNVATWLSQNLLMVIIILVVLFVGIPLVSGFVSNTASSFGRRR